MATEPTQISSQKKSLVDISSELLQNRRSESGVPVKTGKATVSRDVISHRPGVIQQRQGGDTIGEAVPIAIGDTDTGTTEGYNDDYDEVCPFSGSTSPDVVYVISLDSTTTLNLDLCESGYDTKIYVYDPDLNLMGCNDDACSDSEGNPFRSYLQIMNLAPGDYYIVVDGYAGNFGEYTLTVTAEEPCELECPPDATLEDEPDCGEDYEDVTNGGCNSDPPVFGAIADGETVCGTMGTYLYQGENRRDTDWFLFSLDEPSIISLSGQAEYPVQMAVVSYTDCDDYTIIANITGEECQDIALTTSCVLPGDYVVFVAPTEFSGVPCGTFYYVSLTTEVCEPAGGDYCTDPIIIEELPYSTTGTTTDNLDTFGNASADEWYQVTVPDDGLLEVSLCGSSYDTYLWIVQDDCATEVAHNDDSCGLQSYLEVLVNAGTYNICVEGYSSNTGEFVLDVDFQEFNVETGEYCGDPIIIEDFPAEFEGTTSDNIDTYGYTAPDEWYEFTLEDQAIVNVSLCGSSFNTFLRILQDCNTQIATNDDFCGEQSQLVTMLGPGTFQICVEGAWGEQNEGEYILSVELVDQNQVDGADNCEDAVMINSVPFVTMGTTTDNSDTYGSSSPDEWFMFNMTQSGEVTISLCGSSYDTYLRLLTDDCATEIAYNDDYCGLQSQLDLALDPGAYRICVEGWSSSSGTFVLSVDGTGIAPQEGNDCEHAIVVPEIPFSDTLDTSIYGDTGFNPSGDVYYSLLIQEEGMYRFTTCVEEGYAGMYDTFLRLLGEDCSTVIEENDNGCNGAGEQLSTLEYCLPQGYYYLMVEGAGEAEGVYQLNITYEGECAPCDPVECPEWGIAETEPNDGGANHEDIGVGETYCGSVWSSSSARDMDYYQFTLESAEHVDFFLDAAEDEAVIMNMISHAGGGQEVIGEGVPQNNCSDYLLSMDLDAGTYSVLVWYDDWYGENPSSDYVLAWGTDAVAAPLLPTRVELMENYPNPFNPVTRIGYGIPESGEVELAVYDVRGVRVAELVRGRVAAGRHVVEFDGSGLGSGVYFYVLRSGDTRLVRKMLLVK
jgi:hypothetical protein